jgi:HEAT repeat protein
MRRSTAAVVIRSSSAREVEQLLHDLRDASAVRREAAIARLRVLGSRAVARLETLVQAGSDPDRVLALQALEGIDDPRVVDVALAALHDAHPGVRLQAIQALRPWVAREEGTRVMEALVACALAGDQGVDVRAAVRDALSQLPSDIIQPVLEQMPAAVATDVVPGEPAAIQAWIAAHEDAPLSSLHAVISALRGHESREAEDTVRVAWSVARGAGHAALARRGSAVALYDLRETFDRAAVPLPLDYLTAITLIGDASCVESLARSWFATPPAEVWWRERVADAAATIASRLKLTKRHAIVKRIHTRWPGFLR